MKAPFCSLLLAARQVKWRGKLNLTTGEKSWHTVLCGRWPNKVSCKNHSSTPGISMHAFSKETKRKQKWTTFTRIPIHRQACQRNTVPCAPSILKHRVSAEVCLLLIGTPVDFKIFYIEKVQYHQYTRSRKIHWTLLTQEMREDLQINFFSRNVLWTFPWEPTKKRQYLKFPPPPPPKKTLMSFRTG